MKTLRFSLFTAFLCLFAITLSATGQTPSADRKKLEEILKQQGITDPAQINQIEMVLKQKGISIAQVEQAMQRGQGFGGKGGYGKGGFGKGGFGGQGGFGGLGRGGQSMAESLSAPLVDADTLAKVKLTPQQKTAYTKLAAEFDSKNKELTSKIPASAPGGGRAQIEAQIRERFGKGGGGGGVTSPEAMKSLDLRKEYEQKFEEMLTEAQKKVLEEIKVKQAESLLTGGSK